MTTTTPQEASHLHTRLESPTLPILLRTTEARDAPRFSAVLSDPSSASDPNAKPLDIPTAQNAITKQRESAAVPTVLNADGSVASGPGRVNMVVVLKGETAADGAGADGLVIGLGGYGAIKDWVRDGKNIRAGDVGALIEPAYRGRGYATEAFRLAIDWAFTPVSEGGPQLDLVTITTLDDNAAMVKLADEKLGLKSLGQRRGSPEEGGEGKFEMYYELTKMDWEEVSAQLKK